MSLLNEKCRLCASDLEPLIHFGSHPIAHRFLTRADEESYVHPVDLRLCRSCSLVQLVNPIAPEELYSEYFSLSSWKPQPHQERLVELIRDHLKLKKDARILEAGCNDGGFLQCLNQHGYKNTLGVEPAKDACEGARKRGINVVEKYFDVELARQLVKKNGPCNLFIARQVLEHISDLKSFREAITVILKPGGHVLLEVPHFDFSLREFDYSAIWEEHVNYFTLESLRLFLAGIKVGLIHDETFCFSGEALIVIGQHEKSGYIQQKNPFFDLIIQRALAYRDFWPQFRQSFIEYLESRKGEGRRIAVYGSGCRACSLINFTGIGTFVDHLLDDQPEKQGKYLPGSRLLVEPSAVLRSSDIDLCLLAVNAENDGKVMACYPDFFKRGGEAFSLLPPSTNMLPIWRNVNAYQGV